MDKLDFDNASPKGDHNMARLAAFQAEAATQQRDLYGATIYPVRAKGPKRGRRGLPGRSVIAISGDGKKHLHATKGWRGGPTTGSKGMPHVR